jgi:hypothetical protein
MFKRKHLSRFFFSFRAGSKKKRQHLYRSIPRDKRGVVEVERTGGVVDAVDGDTE